MVTDSAAVLTRVGPQVPPVLLARREAWRPSEPRCYDTSFFVTGLADVATVADVLTAATDRRISLILTRLVRSCSEWRFAYGPAGP